MEKTFAALKTYSGYLLVFIVLLGGLFLSGIVFTQTNISKQTALRREFVKTANEHFNTISEALEQYAYTLSSLKAFYHASEEITWTEFEIFSSNILADFKDVSWVGWV